MLAWGKYDSALSVQPDSAITAMIIVSVVIPVIIYATAALVLCFWDLEKYQKQISTMLTGEVK